MAEQVKAANIRELMRDTIPSVLAYPDSHALSVLLPVYSVWLQKRKLINLDGLAYTFVWNSLMAFDDELLLRAIPAATLHELCQPKGRCRESLERAILR